MGEATTLTADTLQQIARSKDLMLSKEQAQELINDHKEWFGGKTIKGYELTALIREKIGVSPLERKRVD